LSRNFAEDFGKDTLAGWLLGWLAGYVVGWLASWLAGCRIPMALQILVHTENGPCTNANTTGTFVFEKNKKTSP